MMTGRGFLGKYLSDDGQCHLLGERRVESAKKRPEEWTEGVGKGQKGQIERPLSSSS
jgi:hypothetical protein